MFRCYITFVSNTHSEPFLCRKYLGLWEDPSNVQINNTPYLDIDLFKQENFVPGLEFKACLDKAVGTSFYVDIYMSESLK